MVVAAAGVITVAVLITAAVIKELMRNNSSMQNSLSATIENKFKDGNHTVIKVKLRHNNGSTSTQEIRSDKGATVYEGQTIYN